MTLHKLLVCALSAWLVGCGGASQESPSAAKPNDEAAERAHEDEPNTVEVEEAMLRDLRVTTRPVESRAGGDVAVLLGELAVDERAYAEVSAPAGARVSRLLVNAG